MISARWQARIETSGSNFAEYEQMLGTCVAGRFGGFFCLDKPQFVVQSLPSSGLLGELNPSFRAHSFFGAEPSVQTFFPESPQFRSARCTHLPERILKESGGSSSWSETNSINLNPRRPASGPSP